MSEQSDFVVVEEVTADTPASAMRRSANGKLIPVGNPLTSETAKEMAVVRRGRPKGLAKRVRDMVGDDPERIVNVLFDILEDETARDNDRIGAARELLDRGWGKAPAYAPILDTDPLEQSDLDKAIRDIAEQLVAKKAHPTLDAEVVSDEAAA